LISVILYGRNDAHGYNLHRRAALSLNCLAEVLTAPDDEIVFVDYNTPDELATFIEALSDTLTEHCLDLLRVLRVRPELHAKRFAGRTHLPALEPVARNAAARRTRASNRWLLSTNTDMIFLPLAGQSLSEICSDLPDGFYGLPRFELPEWLWEQLPRSDPRGVLAELERLGPGLRLDEPTVSHELVRFDAPGDFQLILRDDLVAIDGFNEEMLLGWHVDSNLSRRMLFRRDSIDSLEDRLAAYHCNHNRTPTVYHGSHAVMMNDLERFFASVDRADLPEQRVTWGLADVELEEVPVRERVGATFADAVVGVIPKSPPSSSHTGEAALGLTYDSGHVLPFVADSLVVSPPGATIAYVGANPILRQMLGALVAGIHPRLSLAVADLEDDASVGELLRTADVFVVDLGVDASLVQRAPDMVMGYEPTPLLTSVPRVFAALDQLVDLERARVDGGEHPRRIVLVNSSTMVMDPYVTAQLDCSHTTTHSRVRRATVKPVARGDYATKTAAAQGRRLIHWSIRTASAARLPLQPRANVRIADLEDYRAFGEGWAFPDEYGIWTQGEHSELALAFDGIAGGSYRLALSIRGVCVGRGDELAVDVLLDRTPVAARSFPLRHLRMWWVELPARVVADGKADLSLRIHEPRTPLSLGWSLDERRLGILIRSVELQRVQPWQLLTDGLVRAYLYLRATIGFRRHFRRLARVARPSTAVPRRTA
jgi:hypothetical protein